jgi:hypothetical protein
MSVTQVEAKARRGARGRAQLLREMAMGMAEHIPFDSLKSIAKCALNERRTVDAVIVDAISAYCEERSKELHRHKRAS